MLFQKSFERIIGLFVTLSMNEKIGTREKSLDDQIVQIIEVQIIKIQLQLLFGSQKVDLYKMQNG